MNKYYLLLHVRQKRIYVFTSPLYYAYYIAILIYQPYANNPLFFVCVSHKKTATLKTCEI